jgi:hypothetical protein
MSEYWVAWGYTEALGLWHCFEHRDDAEAKKRYWLTHIPEIKVLVYRVRDAA